MTTARNRRARYLVRMGTITQHFDVAATGFAAIRKYLKAYDKDLRRGFRPLWLRFSPALKLNGIGKQWTYTNDRGMVLATIRRIA